MVQNIFRNTKKVIPKFCDFFGPNFLWHKTDKSWFLMIFKAEFRQIVQCVPKKGYFRFWSLFVVNFIEMTYKLVSRSETVQIKWKNHKVRYFRFLTPNFRNFQNMSNLKNGYFYCSFFPVKTSNNDHKTTYNDLQMATKYIGTR